MFPIYFPWSDGTRCHDLHFWMLNFKPTFSLSSFTFIKRLFNSSSLSDIRVVLSAYLRLLIFLPAILIVRVQLQQPGNQPEGVSGVGGRWRSLWLIVWNYMFISSFYTWPKHYIRGLTFLVFPTQIYCLQKSLLPYRVPVSAILSESALLSIIYFLLCVLYLTCDYIVTHATFLSLFLIFLNPVCP